MYDPAGCCKRGKQPKCYTCQMCATPRGRGGETPQQEDSLTFEIVAALLFGNHFNIFFTFPVCGACPHRQCCPQEGSSWARPPPSPPGLCPAPGCENGEAGTQGLPGSIPSSQKFPTRAKGQEEGGCSGLHVILLISSIFPCAEQWPGNAPPEPPCPGRHYPSHCGAGKGVTDGPGASTDPQHNLQYGHAKLSFASQTAAPSVGDKGSQSSARAGASSPAPPAAHCPQ